MRKSHNLKRAYVQQQLEFSDGMLYSSKRLIEPNALDIYNSEINTCTKCGENGGTWAFDDGDNNGFPDDGVPDDDPVVKRAH